MRKAVNFKLSYLSLYMIVLMAVLAVGVPGDRESQAQETTLPLDFYDVVIFATHSVRLKKNVEIIYGDVVVN